MDGDNTYASNLYRQLYKHALVFEYRMCAQQQFKFCN